MSFILSPRARVDLAEIWDHTVRRWGVGQAERYVRQIESTLQLLWASPGLGRSADAIRAGYRTYPCGAHIIFYRPMAAGIDVVRILHQRMDIERISDRHPTQRDAAGPLQVGEKAARVIRVCPNRC